MRIRICAPGLVLSLALTRLAAAQTPDSIAAEALFKAAREAVARGDYETACPKFERSQRLDPGDGTLFNLADCEEHLGHFVSAAQHWREAAEMLPASDPRRPAALEKAAAADRRVARLVLRLVSNAPPGTTVKLDDAEVASAGLGKALPVDPGRHRVVVRASGRDERQFPLTLAEGEQQELTVAPGGEIPPAVKPPPPPVPPPPVVTGGQTFGPGPQTPDVKPPSFLAQHQWSLIGLGASAGLAGAGLGLGIRTLSHHKEFIAACQEDSKGALCLDNQSSLRRETIAANVLFGVAGAVAVTSGVLFFTVESRGKKKSAPSIGFAPGAGSLTVVGRY